VRRANASSRRAGCRKSHLATELAISVCRHRERVRFTGQTYIIKTGAESYRFVRTLEKGQKRTQGGVAARFCSRFALRAMLQQNRSLPSKLQRFWGGQIKRPKQARTTCQTQVSSWIRNTAKDLPRMPPDFARRRPTSNYIRARRGDQRQTKVGTA
jgi:hypothetical protein